MGVNVKDTEKNKISFEKEGHVYRIKVLHEGHNFSESKPEAFLLAEDHDLSEGDGAALVGVDLVEKLFKRNLRKKNFKNAKYDS